MATILFFTLHCFGHITIGKIKLIFICSKQCFRPTLLMLTTCCFLYIIRKKKISTNSPCSMDLLKMCLIVFTKCTEHQRLLCMVKSKKKSFTNLLFICVIRTLFISMIFVFCFDFSTLFLVLLKCNDKITLNSFLHNVCCKHSTSKSSLCDSL